MLVGITGGISYKFFSTWKWIQENQIGQEQEILVSRQDLVSTLSLMGKSKIKNEQSLNFNTPGKVTAVYVTLWQQVEKWFLLAEIDKKDVLSSIEEKKVILEQAEIRYENFLSERDLEEQKKVQEIETHIIELEKKKNDRKLLLEEQAIEKKNKEIQKSTLEIDIEKMQQELKNDTWELERSPLEKKLELSEAENSYTLLKNEYNIAYQNLDAEKQKQVNEYNLNFQNQYLDIKNFLLTQEDVLQSYNELLDIDDEYRVSNADLSSYFSLKNTTYRSQARTHYHYSRDALAKLENYIQWFETFSDPEQIIQAMNLQKIATDSLYTLADAIIGWVDNSLTSDGTVSEDDFASYKSLAQSQSALQADALIEIEKQKDEIQLLKNPNDENTKIILELQSKKNEMEKQEFALEKLKEELSLLESSLSWEKQKLINAYNLKQNEGALITLELQKLQEEQQFDLSSLDAEIQSSSLDLQEKQELLEQFRSPNNEDFTSLKTSLRQAQIDLENEQKNIEEYELRAPFAGTVSQLNIFSGDNLIDQDKTKNISLQNPYIVEVQVQVDQVDLVKIDRGQETEVYFDAYPEKAFSGSVIDINATPNMDSWLSKYEVTILLDISKAEEKIYSGMTARAEIILQKLEQVISIPSLSLEIDTETWENFVTVIGTNGSKKKQVVETWFSDGVQTEIISWLQEGDAIVEINYAENTLPEESFWNPYGAGGWAF